MEEIRKRVMKDAEEAFAREVLNRLRTWILSHTRLRSAETGLNINMTFQPAMTPPKPRNGDWMWMAADGEAQGGHQPLGVGGPPSPPDFGWTSCGLHKPWVTASSKGWRWWCFTNASLAVWRTDIPGWKRRGIDGASEHARRVRNHYNHCIARSVHSISVLSRLYTTCQPERASERTNLIKGLSRWEYRLDWRSYRRRFATGNGELEDLV